MITNKCRNHKIVAVKTTSFVDVGIAQLVTILNEIPNVSTFSSCEGRIGRETDDAHVYMSYGETRKQTWYSMGEFASKLAKILGQSPQVGHVPYVAGLQFLIVTDLGSFISFLARHFTQ